MFLDVQNYENKCIDLIMLARPGMGGAGVIIGAPTSPLGLSPKIEEEEKRRS